MSYELMSNHFGAINFCWQKFKEKFAKFNVNITDEDITSAIELRSKDIKSYCDFAVKTNNHLASLQKTKWSGFKLFPGQLKYKYEDPVYSLELDYIISKIDCVIFLNRPNIESIFSYLQARATNEFGLLYRDVKMDILKLEESFEGGYQAMEYEAYNLLKMKHETYTVLLDVCKKQNKKLLSINYEDFAAEGWNSVSSFLETPICTDFYPFNKFEYNYKLFSETYPNIKKIADNFNLVEQKLFV